MTTALRGKRVTPISRIDAVLALMLGLTDGQPDRRVRRAELEIAVHALLETPVFRSLNPALWRSTVYESLAILDQSGDVEATESGYIMTESGRKKAADRVARVSELAVFVKRVQEVRLEAQPQGA